MKRLWISALCCLVTLQLGACNEKTDKDPCEDPNSELCKDPCKANPTSEQCTDLCTKDPESPQCSDLCTTLPDSDACSALEDFCDKNPDAEQCQNTPGPNKPTGSAKLAELCSGNRDCSSGLCITLGQGINDSLCSQRCKSADDCGDQDVWDCIRIDSSSNDDTSACVPKDLCLDKDKDGYGIGPGCLGPDCDDDDTTVYFGAPEICDGKDNDCNGAIDDNPIDDGTECDTGLEGVCAVGESECTSEGKLSCRVLIQPGQQQELCDGLDNDCDGLVDESPIDDKNDNYVDGTGGPCSSGIPGCQNGLLVCDPLKGITCEVHEGDKDDTCNGIDDDCNGQVDDDVPGLNKSCTVGEGECLSFGITKCVPGKPYSPPECDADIIEPSSDEICDYKDNNCDGQVDEDFKDSNGVYYLAEHCGSCEVNCNDFWADNAYKQTVITTCNVQGQNAQCDYDCAEGFEDLDGNKTNGCEYATNKDSVYVAPSNRGGENGGFCTFDRPCNNIAAAIRAINNYKTTDPSNPRTKIIVAEGIYREGVTIPNGVSLLGGHNARNWVRNIKEHRTVVVGSVKETGDRYTVLAEGIDKATELSGFTIIGEDAHDGNNSIGLLIRNSSNKLVIKDNTIQAGAGGQGVAGKAGAEGAEGTNGAPGAQGTQISSSTCAAGNERPGGNGGSTTCGGDDVSGGAGARASCPSYGKPGAAASAGKGTSGKIGTAGKTAYGRGLYESACYPHPDEVANSFPSDGGQGKAGEDGAGGNGANQNAGSLDANGMWRAASGGSGANGANGSGGGGGGASHGTMLCTGINSGSGVFQDCDVTGLIGSSGGGGGSGGCSAKGATGGGGGGGSFAVYLYASSSSTTAPVFSGNTFERNLGGQGGDGGIGGKGGDGGLGGVGGIAAAQTTFCPQAGRSGGQGGRGGHGGGGGGGAGGLSFDVAVFGVELTESNLAENNTFFDETAPMQGAGGPGGGSLGHDGNAGKNGLASGKFYNP